MENNKKLQLITQEKSKEESKFMIKLGLLFS